VIVVSHRGPFAFTRDPNGTFSARRGAGGVVSALGPLLLEDDAHTGAWVAAAIGPDDRAAVEAGQATAEGIDLRYLVFDHHTHHLAYDMIANGVLWFLHHGLFDHVSAPVFDPELHEAWDAFVAMNAAFAEATLDAADDHDGPVLIQDYQLSLVPGMIRARRPDLEVTHFTHTPFCGPNSIRVLPDAWGRALCESLASVPCGFHVPRWRNAFEASVRTVLGADTELQTFTAPLGPDSSALTNDARAEAVDLEIDRLLARVGDRALIIRTDRMEPSKNIVRGFLAYEQLLHDHPEWRERVVFVAMLYRSRQTLPVYVRYAGDVAATAQRINQRFGTEDWTPIVIDDRDDVQRSFAGLRAYDVLVTNPLKDGMNLVAKEGPILNDRDGVLCLSPEAGAWDELHSDAVAMHPYDVVSASHALLTALTMTSEERAARATGLRAAASANGPASWISAQLAAARRRD